jgi:hypothetical protein
MNAAEANEQMRWVASNHGLRQLVDPYITLPLAQPDEVASWRFCVRRHRMQQVYHLVLYTIFWTSLGFTVYFLFGIGVRPSAVGGSTLFSQSSLGSDELYMPFTELMGCGITVILSGYGILRHMRHDNASRTVHHS